MKFVLCILYAILAHVSTGSIHSLADKYKKVLIPRLTDKRIVGGDPVDINHHPHQVTLRYKTIEYPKDPYFHYCGGSIYSDRVIITAAHCIIGKVPSQFHVVAGTKFRKGNDGFIAPVQEIIMHENYDPDSNDNDIAILTLGTPLPLNNFTVRAIELDEHEPRVGVMSTVTGWGSTLKGYPDILQEVHVPIISNEMCNTDYEGEITDSMLCAGYRGVGEKDACQGDSGGPLVVNGKLVGVVSWGYGCARPEYPGIYARISHLLPWIKKKVAQINGH